MASKILWKCECGKSISAPPEMGGRSYTCPKCGRQGFVPVTGESADEIPVVEVEAEPEIDFLSNRKSSSRVEVENEIDTTEHANRSRNAFNTAKWLESATVIVAMIGFFFVIMAFATATLLFFIGGLLAAAPFVITGFASGLSVLITTFLLSAVSHVLYLLSDISDLIRNFKDRD
jgi:hypothetical protein